MKHFIYFLSILVVLFFSSCTSKETLKFRDVKGNVHKFEVNKNATFHNFENEKFKKVDNKIIYEDENYTIRQGLDISRHDGIIDWKKVKEQGYDFIILRAAWRGYQTGIMHTDENFHENIKGAIAEGFDIGVYVFSQAINEEEALEEAEFVLNEIKDYEIKLPVVYDPESIPWEEARTDDISGEVFTANTILFCEKIKEAGYEPMIYANHMWEAFKFDMEKLKNYKFWYADYEDVPQLPYAFEFWQYTEKQKVEGIEKECDADVWIIKN